MRPDKTESLFPGVFQGLRLSRTYTFHLDSSPSQVFALLCPERERSWVSGWQYQMIYSESGYAEPGCIFLTSFEPEGDAVWVMNEYSPDSHLRIIKTCSGLFLLDWGFDLTEPENDKTDLKMTYTMTGLSPAGNEHVQKTMDIVFPRLMERLEKSMDHYLKTGKMLEVSG